MGLLADPEFHVKLTGSWEVMIGPLDTFGECTPVGALPI